MYALPSTSTTRARSPHRKYSGYGRAARRTALDTPPGSTADARRNRSAEPAVFAHTDFSRSAGRNGEFDCIWYDTSTGHIALLRHAYLFSYATYPFRYPPHSPPTVRFSQLNDLPTFGIGRPPA